MRGFKKGLVFLAVFAFIFSFNNSFIFAAERDEEVQALKQQVRELLKRIEKLEDATVVKTKEPVAGESVAPKVGLVNALSKLKLKGRFAAGYLASGDSGSYSSGAFEVPDAKIQFSFQPDEINTVVARMNFNNATLQTPSFDYLYYEAKDFLPALKETPYTFSGKLGRFKLGFGEETLSNNPIEGVLPSNSAGNLGATDEGLELSGKVNLDKMALGKFGAKPLGWQFSVSNGNTGVGTDSGMAKAVMGKLMYTPIDPLYLTVSAYDSGNLNGSNAEMTIAGIATKPTGAGEWRRRVWEVDARYDLAWATGSPTTALRLVGKGKKMNPLAYSDSKAILRLSYGEFHDIASIGRAGSFGFVEGMCNLTKKIYTAGRYSFADIFGDGTASLNGITANRYDRYSLGAGYRWTENTHLKLGYDWNKESQASTEDKPNNLLSILMTTQF